MPNQCAEAANRHKILLSTRDVAQIVRLMRTLIHTGGTLSGIDGDVERLEQFAPSGDTEDVDKLRMLARKMYVRRQARRRHFPTAYFHEPAWDMLLALYASCDATCGTPVSTLLTYAATPPTTALRYLGVLEHYGHIQRHRCPHDKRVIYVDLSPAANEAMSRYLAAVIKSGNL